MERTLSLRPDSGNDHLHRTGSQTARNRQRADESPRKRVPLPWLQSADCLYHINQPGKHILPQITRIHSSLGFHRRSYKIRPAAGRNGPSANPLNTTRQVTYGRREYRTAIPSAVFRLTPNNIYTTRCRRQRCRRHSPHYPYL